MTTGQSGNPNSISLGIIEFIEIFLENKKAILFVTLLSALISAILLYFVFDLIYYSSAIVKTSNKSSLSSLSTLLGEGIPDFSDIGNLSGGTSAKEMAFYEEILYSRKAIDEILTKYNLYYEWDYKYKDDAIKHFRENVIEIKKNKTSGTMEIGIYDKIPARSKEILEYVISLLNKINTDVNIQNAKNNREFIEKRYLIAKEELKIAEDSMRIYQDNYGIAPDIIAKSSVQAVVQIEADIKSEELKLDMLKSILDPNQGEVKFQEKKIQNLKNQLNEMKNDESDENYLNLKGKPGKILKYLRLQRNVEIQNKILLFLLPIYEQAKIEENKETPSVLVLDPPNLPEKKVKPKRLTFTAISTFSGFLLCFLFFVLKRKVYYYVQAFKR